MYLYSLHFARLKHVDGFIFNIKIDSIKKKEGSPKTKKSICSDRFVWQVHLLNDDARGATVEAVISRMKTVQSTMTRNSSSGNKDSLERASMRLIAISATIPNVEDVS